MSAEKTHYDMARSARAMAQENWGTEEENGDAAMQRLSDNNEIAAGALLELVLRINQAIDAWSEDGNDKEHPPRKDDNCVANPDFEVGESGYHAGLDYGLHREIVIFKDTDGHVLIVRCPTEAPMWQWTATWSWWKLYKTPEEAAAAAAKERVAVANKHLTQAKKVLTALEKGKPFENLINSDE
jgi:hypothetical protein